MSDAPENLPGFDAEEWEEYECEEEHGILFWLERYILALFAVAVVGGFFWFLDRHKNRNKKDADEKQREREIQETVVRISRRESLQNSRRGSRDLHRGSNDLSSNTNQTLITPKLSQLAANQQRTEEDADGVSRVFDSSSPNNKPPKVPSSLAPPFDRSRAEILIGDDRLNVSSNIFLNSEDLGLHDSHSDSQFSGGLGQNLAEISVSASVEVSGQNFDQRSSDEMQNSASGEISDFQDQNSTVNITVNLPPITTSGLGSPFEISGQQQNLDLPEIFDQQNLDLTPGQLVTSSQESGFLDMSHGSEGQVEDSAFPAENFKTGEDNLKMPEVLGNTQEIQGSAVQVDPESSGILKHHGTEDEEVFKLPRPEDFSRENLEGASRELNENGNFTPEIESAGKSAAIEPGDSKTSSFQEFPDQEQTETFTISLQKLPEDSKLLRKSSDFQTPDEEFPPPKILEEKTAENLQQKDAENLENKASENLQNPDASENVSANVSATLQANVDNDNEQKAFKTGEAEDSNIFEDVRNMDNFQKSPEDSKILSRSPVEKDSGQTVSQNLEAGQSEQKSEDAQFLQKSPAASKILIKAGQKPPQDPEIDQTSPDSQNLQKSPESSKILLRSTQKLENFDEISFDTTSDTETDGKTPSSKMDEIESDLVLTGLKNPEISKIDGLAHQDSFDSADFDAVSVKVPGANNDHQSSHSRSERETESVVSGGSSLLELLGATDTDDALTKVTTLAEVSAVMREAGLQSSNLIFGIDYTASNKYQGEESFGGFSLHSIRKGILNPYQQVISIVGKTLMPFASSGQIPAFGFGDAKTSDWSVFPLKHEGYAQNFDELLRVYTKMTPKVILSGPTNFAPLIYQSIEICKEVKDYHILVIVADGQVTNERATRRAIVDACKHPLSIIVVGVGDGPWDQMRVFDSSLPKRPWDNFHFVEFEHVVAGKDKQDVAFALESLMEIPDQYKLIKKLGLLE